MSTKAQRLAKRAPINERGLLTVDQAADYLSISRDKLDEFRDVGDIKPIQLGTRNLRYRRSDLDSLIDAMADGTTKLGKVMGW